MRHNPVEDDQLSLSEPHETHRKVCQQKHFTCLVSGTYNYHCTLNGYINQLTKNTRDGDAIQSNNWRRDVTTDRRVRISSDLKRAEPSGDKNRHCATWQIRPYPDRHYLVTSCYIFHRKGLTPRITVPLTKATRHTSLRHFEMKVMHKWWRLDMTKVSCVQFWCTSIWKRKHIHLHSTYRLCNNVTWHVMLC